jgi:ferredoxin-NADP reductase
VNATLFDSVRNASGGGLSFTIGLALLAGLALWVLLEIFRSLLRTAGESRFQRAALEKLRVEVEQTKLRFREEEKAKAGWNGVRPFVVAKKEKQCEDVHAFYLKPHDGRPIPTFKPGQYLTFLLDIPGRGKPLLRCYSLSDIARDYYRVTIKKQKAPVEKPEWTPGVGSSYFNDTLKEGDILNVKAPMGDFYLDMTKSSPIVLLAGGVGITPVLCMAQAITAQAIAANGPKRQAYFFFGVRNRSEHIHKEELEKLAAANDNIKLHVCYSSPEAGDVENTDYQHKGRVTIELLKSVLPASNYDYYFCGSAPFMQGLIKGLKEWEVPEKYIHFEEFAPPAPPPDKNAVKCDVTFKLSEKTVQWDGTSSNLLSFGEANQAKIDSGCRIGKCGACQTAIRKGEVEYFQPHSFQPLPGTCLACCCRPKADLELEA